MKGKIKLLMLGVGLSLASCKSLEFVESKPLSDEVQFSRYDSDSKLRYNVYNSTTHLKVVLSTNDRGSIAKILQGGLTLYFDDQGKKGESTFVTFPTKPAMPKIRMENQEGRSRKPGLDDLIKQLPNAKVYSYLGNSQRLAADEGEIEVEAYSKGEELIYELLIPFERISNRPKAELLEVNIGVVSGTLDMPQERGGPPGGMNGGGPPSGSGPPGGGRPPSSGGGGDRPDMQSLSSPIDFWFKAVLN